MVVVRQFSRAVGLVIWTSIMLSVAEAHRLATPRRHRRQRFDAYVKFWSRGVLRLLGVRVRVVGDRVDPVGGPPRLIVSNHRSALDIPVLLSRFGGVALSRADLARWPMLGYAAQRARTVFVDRESAHSGAAAIRSIRDRLRGGHSVCVFPEGTTYPGDIVRPFSAGAFAAARGFDIVPVGLAYPPGTEFLPQDSFLAHARKIGRRRRTEIWMSAGVPQSGRGATVRRADLAHRAVQSLVHGARRGAR